MGSLRTLTLQGAIDSLSRRPGIVVGPEATRVPGAMSQILAAAFKTAGPTASATDFSDETKYRSAVDELRAASPEKEPLVQRGIEDGLRTLSPSLDLPHLAKAGWSACISLTEDLLFESALKNYMDSVPSARTVTIIDHPSVMPLERTIPVYKLLGNINGAIPERKLAASESALLVRQQFWAALLRTCPDYLRDAPLLFVGVGGYCPPCAECIEYSLIDAKAQRFRIALSERRPDSAGSSCPRPLQSK